MAVRKTAEAAVAEIATAEKVDVMAQQELKLREKMCEKACTLLDSSGTASNEMQIEQVKAALEIYKALKPY